MTDLRAQLTDEERAALIDYVVWHGGIHDDDCPGDDTCECSGKRMNDAANKACRLAALAAPSDCFCVNCHHRWTATAREDVTRYCGDCHREFQRLKTAEPENLKNLERALEDLRSILRALGLFDGARPITPHFVVTDVVLPAIAALRAAHVEPTPPEITSAIARMSCGQCGSSRLYIAPAAIGSAFSGVLTCRDCELLSAAPPRQEWQPPADHDKAICINWLDSHLMDSTQVRRHLCTCVACRPHDALPVLAGGRRQPKEET